MKYVYDKQDDVLILIHEDVVIVDLDDEESCALKRHGIRGVGHDPNIAHKIGMSRTLEAYLNRDKILDKFIHDLEREV